MKNLIPLAVAVAIALSLNLAAEIRADDADGTDDADGGLRPETRIVLMGNGLGSRMLHFGHFEAELHLRYPNHRLYIRNMCDEGNTPSFRPHSGRANQLGFPGAEAFHSPYSDGNTADGIGHFETEEQWLHRLKPDVIIAFFGFNESFQGSAGLRNYQAELDAFVAHTLGQKYNGKSAPKLVLVSPTAFEDVSATMDVPNGQRQNQNLSAYTSVMHTVSIEYWITLVDAFSASLQWYRESDQPLTADGALLNSAGYQRLANLLVDEIFGKTQVKDRSHESKVREAIKEKNWHWLNDFKIPNGVHAFGRRYNPFGPANYPFEINKVREMTAIRDQMIWAALRGEELDVASLDAATSPLPPVETNYRLSQKNGALSYLKGQEALDTITVPEGYKIEQWATESEFPDLANPVQLTFDNKGRLWVATMPSYPHWRPGDPRPDDKLLILEDTDNDGKADKQTVWADGLHLPMGFEITADGVYLSQGINLVKLSDQDGDGKADTREIVFSGFDDHDTHHAISAYTADPSGAIYMCEGVFLRTNVETPYGPVRGTNGGFYRFSPQRRHLERHAQLSIPNPWGVAFDKWGQHFFLHTSGPTVEWMLPGSIKPRYGVSTPGSQDLIEPAHRVRPTSGIEFLDSRHFPDEVQGDMILCNSIGFLGIKQHQMLDDGTGYKTRWRQDLVSSSDGNFRPVDLEIAPDGSLFLVDWHNPLIGHMQHNARDPNRDHAHGRIYRVTYPSRPLVSPPSIAGASIEQLLSNLKLHEYRARYRTRRELRGRDTQEVLAAVRQWVRELDQSDPDLEHHQLEALWVTWGMNQVDQALLTHLLDANDYRVRAAAVRVLRYTGHQVENQTDLLAKAMSDSHGRVQLEAIAAASWQPSHHGLALLDQFMDAQSAKVPDDLPTAEGIEVKDGGRIIHVLVPESIRDTITSFRMTLPGDERIINLSEMQLLTGEVDITSETRLSQSSQYNGGQFPVNNLVDGDRDNFSHTDTQSDPWIKVELTGNTGLDQITIWNRVGYEDRFANAHFEFYAGTKLQVTRRASGLNDTYNHLDKWLKKPFQTAGAHLKNQSIVESVEVEIPKHLKSAAREMYVRGAEIYQRDGFCATCHQPDGLGLESAQFPPLAGTRWVLQDKDRLIKLTLKGLYGPIEVKDKSYPGLVPMTPFGGMLDDNDVAAVLTYVRNSFGNQAEMILPEDVKRVRDETESRSDFYTPEELLKQHPHN